MSFANAPLQICYLRGSNLNLSTLLASVCSLPEMLLKFLEYRNLLLQYAKASQTDLSQAIFAFIRSRR